MRQSRHARLGVVLIVAPNNQVRAPIARGELVRQKRHVYGLASARRQRSLTGICGDPRGHEDDRVSVMPVWEVVANVVRDLQSVSSIGILNADHVTHAIARIVTFVMHAQILVRNAAFRREDHLEGVRPIVAAGSPHIGPLGDEGLIINVVVDSSTETLHPSRCKHIIWLPGVRDMYRALVLTVCAKCEVAVKAYPYLVLHFPVERKLEREINCHFFVSSPSLEPHVHACTYLADIFPLKCRPARLIAIGPDVPVSVRSANSQRAHICAGHADLVAADGERQAAWSLST